MKNIVILVLSLCAFIAKAEPAPFGLIINKTTVEELKAKYPTKSLGLNKSNGLEAFGVEPKHLDFAGLEEMKALFSEDGILKMVQLSMSKDKFEQIFASLSKKYQLIYKNTPESGNIEAKFEEDNSYILLYALKDSENLDCLYINKKLLDEILGMQQEKPKAIQVSQL